MNPYFHWREVALTPAEADLALLHICFVNQFDSAGIVWALMSPYSVMEKR
jgi:hypothetical protein